MTAPGRRRPITTSTCSRRPLDIRAEKAFTFGDRRLIFDVDVVNLFNSSTVLGRQYDVQATGDTGFNRVLEIMNPRIVRLVVRVQF